MPREDGQGRHGKGNERFGSTLEVTREYRACLEYFIKSTPSVGRRRGLWGLTFSRAIDWGDASYLGVDIASDVIKAVRKKHEKGKIKFDVGDITEDLPAADLLISKDVLTSLQRTGSEVYQEQPEEGQYKWVTLTNARSVENLDISNGDHRGIHLPHLRSRSTGSSIFRSSTESRPGRSPRFDLTQQP